MKKYLKDFENYRPFEVLKEFERTSSILVVILEVCPRDSRTGMLEERRDWLKRFWDKIFEQVGSGIMGGSTLLWTVIFFATSHEHEKLIINTFQSVLKSMREPRFKSYCILGKVKNDYEEQKKIIDFMVHHLGSEDDFYRNVPDMVRMIDGKVI